MIFAFINGVWVTEDRPDEADSDRVQNGSAACVFGDPAIALAEKEGKTATDAIRVYMALTKKGWTAPLPREQLST